MRTNSSPIYFYFPMNNDMDKLTLPKSVTACWDWQVATANIHDSFGVKEHWILQTFLYLKKYGFPCSLVTQLPTEGIVVSITDFFPRNYQPSEKLFFIYLVVDRDKDDQLCGNYFVVHNPHTKFSKAVYHIPPWPQIALIPRSQKRGDRFENIGYFGYPWWLVPELKSDVFYNKLQSLGLKWQMPDPAQWNNFSNIDAIVAVRSFGKNRLFLTKPPLKLFNAWLAGVPSILGYESAYHAVKKNELDYIEATSFDEVIRALKKLKDDRELRHAMVENGNIRIKEFAPSKTVEVWKDLFINIVIPEYYKWRRTSSFKKKYFFIHRKLFGYVMKLRKIIPFRTQALALLYLINRRFFDSK